MILKKYPSPGARRTRRAFAWLPTTLLEEDGWVTVWLETLTYEEQVKEVLLNEEGCTAPCWVVERVTRDQANDRNVTDTLRPR